jgi:phosphosulfolactate synthase
MDLVLEARAPKPRSVGRTNILDRGLGIGAIEQYLSVGRQYVDLAKLGWGTSLVTEGLEEKLQTYRRLEIEVCFGGTLFEYFYLKGRVDDYAAWLEDLGIRTVEISDGAVDMPASAKLGFIERLARRFTVYSEVGSKDAVAVASPAKWITAIRAELAAGARSVLLEGRESGTAGMYRTNGEIRMGLIQEIVDSGISLGDIVFEAPQKDQQVWLIKEYGKDVNLANIPPDDVVSLETLRRGLRADTLMHFHGARL